MKIILKISRYLLITILLALALLTGLSLIFQGRITQIFRSEVNKYTETDIDVEKVSFSLLKGFPKATVEFKNISIGSPVKYNFSSDSIPVNSNFLKAENIYASFNVRDILKKKYSIERLAVKNGNLLIIKDSLGLTSSRILKEEYKNDSSKISFDLQNIKIENTGFTYINKQNKFILNSYVNNAEGRLSLTDKRTSIEVKSNFDINSISAKEKTVLNPVLNGELEGKLLLSKDSINFNQLDLIINNQTLTINGHIDHSDRILSLNIASNNTDLDALVNCFPLKKEFCYGIVLDKQNTSVSLNFKDPSGSFAANINMFQTKYAGSVFRGSLNLENLVSPDLDLIVNGNVDLGQLSITHPFNKLETLSGEAHINARLKGKTGSLKTFSFDKLLKLKRSINIHINNVNLRHTGYDYPIQNISGNIMIADNIWADELSYQVSGQNMILNCKIEDAENIFIKNGNIINITAGIWADKLDSHLLLPPLKAENQEGIKKNRSDLKDRIAANLILNVDSLIINKFQSSQFYGILSYRQGFLNINSFNVLTLNGSVSGNAAIIKNSEGDRLSKGWFDIQNIDINKAFTVFNNFGQKQIMAENIRGELSGSFSISAETDPNFKIIPSSLSASGNYSILNGELINFEPMLKLSRFIEVSELEDIKFHDLKNDLIIADQRLLIPSMEINSSAFNISLSGEQHFSGTSEYHLSILLSEILSKKARNSGSYISEFGQVEDDGLGRTTLFLKLEKDNRETRVSYDVKKLSEEIKASLQEEKQSIKTILNDEYGWYKNDSLSARVNTSKRFRITWEEADSINTVRQDPRSSRPGIFKNLFKSDTTKRKF